MLESLLFGLGVALICWAWQSERTEQATMRAIQLLLDCETKERREHLLSWMVKNLTELNKKYTSYTLSPVNWTIENCAKRLRSNDKHEETFSLLLLLASDDAGVVSSSARQLLVRFGGTFGKDVLQIDSLILEKLCAAPLHCAVFCCCEAVSESGGLTANSTRNLRRILNDIDVPDFKQHALLKTCSVITSRSSALERSIECINEFADVRDEDAKIRTVLIAYIVSCSLINESAVNQSYYVWMKWVSESLCPRLRGEMQRIMSLTLRIAQDLVAQDCDYNTFVSRILLLEVMDKVGDSDDTQVSDDDDEEEDIEDEEPWGDEEDNELNSDHARTLEIARAYSTLGLEGCESYGEIRSTYLRLAKTYHPDRLVGKNIDPAIVELAEAKFKQIKTSFEILRQHLEDTE